MINQADLRAVDELCGQLIDAADAQGQHILVVSEDGITPVHDAVHINRELRRAGLLRVREEMMSDDRSARLWPTNPGAQDTGQRVNVAI